ncbi:MAG: glutathione S-transferase [Panacagrimonas sp.]|jgi:glutathione S-transferase|nr:glutathione S-transferase family protein [Panacagrimonas sp.]MCC2657948.1 glutathione S-transferase [Panacagrimonas sp.]
MDSPSAALPLLLHIPLSHYNEKARWALDHKSIAHHRRVIGPDFYWRAWRATGQGKTPILFLPEGRAIHDSTRIIEALERIQPEPALYPADPALRQRALDLEEHFDEALGPSLRACLVTPLFRNDPEIALRVLMTGMSKNFQRLRPFARLLPGFYRKRHQIRDEALEADRQKVRSALDRVESERDGRAYLVGETFSVADLTVAALLSPLLQPDQIQYPIEIELPGYAREYRESVLRHPAFDWAREIYRLHRGTSAQVRRNPSKP